MRFQNKSALSYMFRNFGQLFFIALPVSVLLSFFAVPSSEISFMQSFARGEFTVENYFNAFTQSYSLLRYGKWWWVILIAFVTLAFTISTIIVKIDRHMRVGEMQVFPVKRAFTVFPSALLFLFCCVLFAEVLFLVNVGVAYLIRFINNVTAIVTVAVVLNFFIRFVLAWLFSLLLLTFPLKYSEHYKYNVAMSYSVRDMSKRKRCLLSLSFGYVLSRYAAMCIAYLLHPYGLSFFPYLLVFLFAVMYVPCLAYVLYHESVGGERRDVSRVIFD